MSGAVILHADEIRCALDTLGTTEEKIAKNLREHQIQGKRGDTHRCPIAKYLAQTFNVDYVSVGNGTATVADFWTILPSPVASFIRSFDSGSYESLDETINNQESERCPK